MKVQIVGFDGYDSDFGGFTLHVLINGNEHEIINQCFPYKDGYAKARGLIAIKCKKFPFRGFTLLKKSSNIKASREQSSKRAPT